MKLGDSCRVKLVERLGDSKARVVDVDGGVSGVLLIKGRLRVRKDGTVNAWVIQHDSRKGTYTFGNAYFGKFSISRSIADKYIAVLKKLYDNPTGLIADDLSYLKGMGNRCLKKDQWDWFTTYKYLGYPTRTRLRQFVADTVTQRDLVRLGQHDTLPSFRQEHHSLLSSILFHLSEDIDVDEADINTPVPGVAPDLWARLAAESRRNIKTAERIHAKSSFYTLMHYFVALEQEFKSHLVKPVADTYTNEPRRVTCLQERYQRTHEVLTGRSPFTLGTVRFLGEYVNSRRAREGSEAIKTLSDMLGDNRSEFSALCSLIATHPVGGVAVPQLRNALAHGDGSVIAQLDRKTLDSLRSLLLEPPGQVLPRILSISLKLPGKVRDGT